MSVKIWYKKTVSFFSETWEYWDSFHPTRIASSLSYYGLFALVPLLVIVFWVGSFLLQSQTLESQIITRVASILGPASVNFLQTTFNSTISIGSHPVSALITVIILLFLAITGFDELKQSLDELWQTPRELKPGFLSILSRYFVSSLTTIIFVMVFIAFLVIAKFFQQGLTFVISGVTSQWIATIGGPIVLLIITIVGTFLAFMFLPDWKLPKRHLLVGALITGVFLTLGNIALGYYLTYGATLSTYGVAGSIVAVLIWFYYSSLIFLFGACATWVYNRRRMGEVETKRRDDLRFVSQPIK